MNSLFFRNLLFTILQPGIVAGLIPYYLARDKFKEIVASSFGLIQYIGIVVFAVGLVIMLHCIYRFMVEGKGTLSPADPTKQLVVKGLYKFSRNPMYVGVMMILIGELLFCGTMSLMIYAAFVFIAFNLFVVFREEPRLKRDFGEGYEAYTRKVRRWI